jgi:hypothetical protein
MSDFLIRASMPRDARWSYDDPSGVPEAQLAVRVPETLRGGVERAAAREGLAPGEWLLGLITRGLTSDNAPKAA